MESEDFEIINSNKQMTMLQQAQRQVSHIFKMATVLSVRFVWACSVYGHESGERNIAQTRSHNN